MGLYDQETEDFVEWVLNYSLVSMTGKEATKAIKALQKFSRTKPANDTPVEGMRWLTTLSEHVNELFPGTATEYSPTEVMSHEAYYDVLQVLESVRQRDVMKSGYRPIFDKYDAEVYRKKFKTATSSKSVVRNLHKASRLLDDMIDGLSQSPDQLTSLYIANRELHTHQPTNTTDPVAYFTQLYMTNRLGFSEGSQYLKRVGQMRNRLEAACDYYGLVVDLPVPPEVDAEMQEVDEIFGKYLEAFEELFLEVVFEKIIRMV